MRIGPNKLDDSQWSWVDGTPFYYSNWATGGPDNQADNEFCIVMFPSGEWNDLPCRYVRRETVAYVCQKDIECELS